LFLIEITLKPFSLPTILLNIIIIIFGFNSLRLFRRSFHQDVQQDL
jgi:hypothetical protein